MERRARERATGSRQAAADGRLRARPSRHAVATGPHGLRPLGLGQERDGLVYVPAAHRADEPAPLVLMLHGAGGDARHGLAPLQRLADEARLILVAPESRRGTWDSIVGHYGPDVAFIDRALAQTFSRYAVDAARVAIEGFSDGASYALSLGVANGDLFSHVIAFSPGFMAPPAQHGAPRIFISHGTHDGVLPIDVCSRRVVPQLERAGYDLRYREFDGGHTMPPDVVREALEWLMEPR